MAIGKLYEAWCDKCGDRFEWEYDSLDAMKKLLIQEKWTVTQRRTICCYCNGNYQRDESLIRI